MQHMRRKTFWVVALVGLLAIGLAGQAFANEIANAVRNRFTCADVPGEAITITSTVADHDWNSFELTSGDTIYLVKTGPAKVGRNLDQIADGTTATVEGYTGAGTNYQAEVAEGVNILRAKTITIGETVIDLTQVNVGGFGHGNGGAGCTGTGAQARGGNGGRGGQGRMGGNGTGVCPR
jgi:hypothetical protein